MAVNRNPEVDKYISTFPEKVRVLLEQMREIITGTVPEAEEVISYKMPAYQLNGMLVYFAGYKQHIGFYPTASGIANFKKEIAGFKNSKGAVQFPLDQPLPATLISKIVKFKVKENKLKKKAAIAKK